VFVDCGAEIISRGRISASPMWLKAIIHSINIEKWRESVPLL